jgi:hypothetical protein
MSDIPYDGWWQASDGRWYPPDTQPGEGPGGPQAPPAGWYQDEDGSWHPPQAPNGAPEPTPGRPAPRSGARRGAVIALAIAAVAVIALLGGLVWARHDPSPTDVDSKTEINSTLPPETVIAPVPGSNSTSTSTSSTSVAPTTTAPLTPSGGP